MFNKVSSFFNKDDDSINETMISYGDCCDIFEVKDELGGKND